MNSEEYPTMYSKGDKIEVMMGNKTDKIIEDRFDFFTKIPKKFRRINERKRICLNCVDSSYYKLQKISVNRSYIDSPKWLKNKKATINPGNNNAKRFQYAITVALKVKQREYQTLNPLLINMIGKE